MVTSFGFLMNSRSFKNVFVVVQVCVFMCCIKRYEIYYCLLIVVDQGVWGQGRGVVGGVGGALL